MVPLAGSADFNHWVTQNNINGPNRNRWFTYENSMVIFHGELLYSHNQMVDFFRILASSLQLFQTRQECD